jgi:hypothetical protein
MISVHAHHLYFDLVSLLDSNSCFSNDLNNLFIEEGFPVLNRENNMVMNLPCTMVSFSNRAIRVHPLSITTNPCSKLQGTFKLDAGIELKKLTTTLCDTHQSDFTTALDIWHDRWFSFLKERTVDLVTGRWHYTHKRLRSAYRSLRLNLPYLFTYEKYPELNIPNTTNSLNGCFAYLKELVRVHRGSRRDLKDKIIEEILRK